MDFDVFMLCLIAAGYVLFKSLRSILTAAVFRAMPRPSDLNTQVKASVLTNGIARALPWTGIASHAP
jgi:hypothetical protein